jgi:galactose mutarotase-like enzyme
MESNDKIREENLRRQMDLRVQPRNLKAELITTDSLQQYVDAAEDVSEQAVVCSEPQPAIGSFNPEDLERIQITFPRYTWES